MTRGAIILPALGLGLGLLSVLLSSPVFAFGVWQQSEPVVIAVHAGAALCWLGIAAAGPAELVARVKSPLIMPALALALWGAVAACLSGHPLAGLLGPPQTGEGALWSLDLAAYTLAAWGVRDRAPKTFGRMIAVGSGVVLIVAICNAPILRAAVTIGEIPRFFSFPKFLAFSALGLFPAAWALRDANNRAWTGVMAIAVVGVVLSENRTAIAGLAMVPVILIRWRSPPSGGGRRFVLPLTVAAVTAVAVAPYILLRYGDWLHGTFSLWSRSILLAVVDRHIFDDPMTALFGHGWGNYQEYLARHVGDTGISLVDSSWKDLTRDEFHSHNAVIEAAFAAGVPGAVLAILLRAGTALGARPAAFPIGFAFALSVALTEATWFMLPVSLAFLAIGAAALAPEGKPAAFDAGRSGRVGVASAGCAAVLTMAIAALLVVDGAANQRLMACLRSDTCDSLAPSRRPMDQDLAMATMIVTSGIVTSGIVTARSGKAGEPADRSLAELVRRLAARPEPSRSALLSLALVNTFGTAAFLPEKSRFGPLSPQDEILWRDELIRLLTIAPGRMDVAAIYLNWLVRQGRDGEGERVLPALEHLSPSHPVVLWFGGLRMLAQPGDGRQQQGLARLRQALDGGIARYTQVPQDAEAMIRAAVPAP